MTKTATRIWDPAEHLQSDESMAAYLEAARETGEASVLAIEVAPLV
jgi:DNA-binding phage protein